MGIKIVRGENGMVSLAGSEALAEIGIDAAAAELVGTIFWDKPLRDAQLG